MEVREERNIITSSAPKPEVPLVDLYTFIIKDWANWAERVALVDTSNQRPYSFQQVQDSTEQIASSMRNHGLQCGDVVSVWCSSGVEMVLGFLAAWKIGATVAAIGSSLTPDEGRKQIEKVKSAFAYISLNNGEKLQKSYNALEVLFSYGGCNFVSLFPRKIHISSSSSVQRKISLNDTCVILFSSGTTGLPKPVELTHINMVTSLEIASLQYRGRPVPAELIFLPLTHFFGLGSVLKCLFDGSTTLIMPRFDLEEFLRIVSEHKLLGMRLVPPVAVMMSNHPELLRKYDLSSLSRIYCAGDTLSLETVKRLKNLLPDTFLVVSQGYGLTETTGAISRTNAQTPIGSVGSIIPLLQLKIVDLDTGRACGALERGEIAVRGPTVMKGYLDDPKATAQMIDSDGWLHTGDIAYYDKDGFIFIVDRIKEMIKHKGQQVAPAELEEVLRPHPDVIDVAVSGIPDEVMGEKPMAFIIKSLTSRTTEKQFQEYVAERVAPYKQLTGGVRFVSSIPKSPTGKVLRRILRENLKNSRL